MVQTRYKPGNNQENIMKKHIVFDTPLGLMELCEQDGCITEVNFLDDAKKVSDNEPTPLLTEAKRQMLLYLEGKLTDFDLPLAFMEGTPFQKRVWEALKTIPYGETRSYSELAKMIGNEKACRAVGGANNKNPLAVIVPCHRVIGANGSLVGYGGGLAKKRHLLDLEKKVLQGVKS